MLTIYSPFNNEKSKAWEVFEGIRETWPDEMVVLDNATETEPNSYSMFWGFVNNNLEMVKKSEARGHEYWFTDTPYFGRFDNNNLKKDNHYWRICKNNIHASYIKNCKLDRFQKFQILPKELRKNGKHILVCPSSASINLYLGRSNWLNETINELQKYTDRPIKVRSKPRKNGTSGPGVADVPIEEDLRDAWACVTSCSISAVESITQGIPVFCDIKSFAYPIANTNLKNIESPSWQDPLDWYASLCYQQFTPEEFLNGTAVSVLKEIKQL